MRATTAMAISLLKLRIGVAVAASALAGIAVASGPGLAWWQPIGLALAVLGASGAAGAFNHYYERDLDRLMQRTCKRPFASGAFRASPWWPVAFLVLLAISLGLASLCVGNVAALTSDLTNDPVSRILIPEYILWWTQFMRPHRNVEIPHDTVG